MYILNYFAPLMSRVLKKIEIMKMIMISYNVLQKRLISQKYKKMFSRKIRHVAIRSGSIRWISIRFDASSFYYSMSPCQIQHGQSEESQGLVYLSLYVL